MRMIGFVFGTALAGTLVLAATADPATSVAPPVAAPQAAPLTVTRPDGDMMARRMARRAARLNDTLQAVRSGLQLTSVQDGLWPPVADAMRGLDAARGFRFRQTLAAAGSSIDGLKLQGDHMARMGAAIGQLADATKPLVASLTPDQKSRLPTLLQDVRPRKIVNRAFEVPLDSGSSWGTGQGGPMGAQMGAPGQGAAGPGLGGAASGRRMGGAGTNSPGAGGMDDPQDRDGDE